MVLAPTPLFGDAIGPAGHGGFDPQFDGIYLLLLPGVGPGAVQMCEQNCSSTQHNISPCQDVF